VTPRDLPALVGADVASALAWLGAAAVRATPVSALPARAPGPAAFRVTLADGRTVKVRRFARPARARRFARAVRGLAGAPLAALLLLDGCVAVEGWVEGTPLSALPRRVGRLRRAADVLGRLHAIRRIGARRLPAEAPTRPLVALTARRLVRLADGGAISDAELRAARGLVARFAPSVAAFGVTHNDFCAENVVETRGGDLVAIDNEGLRPGFLDFDLARTWYRWPMPASAWAAFLDGYAAWRDPGAWVRHAPFWCVAALVKSVHVRFERAAAPGVPLRRLRALLAARGASAQPPSARAGRRSARRTSPKDSTRKS